jgi:hypothetical protein
MPKPPLPTGRRNYVDTGFGPWLGEVRATTRERDRGADRQHDRADRINNSEDHIASVGAGGFRIVNSVRLRITYAV